MSGAAPAHRGGAGGMGTRLTRAGLAAWLLCSTLVGCGGAADRTPGAELAAGDSAEAAPSAQLRVAILRCSGQLTLAYAHNDWRTVSALLAPDYLGSAPEANWDRAALEREFQKIRLADCRRDSATVQVLAPGLVLLNEDIRLRETYAGRDISGRYRSTTIWRNRASKWRLLFEQEIPLPALPETR